MIDLGAPTKIKDSLGNVPMHLAVAAESIEIVEMLNDSALGIENKKGYTPLMYGIENNPRIDRNFVFSILKKGAPHKTLSLDTRAKNEKKEDKAEVTSALEIARKQQREDLTELLRAFTIKKDDLIISDDLMSKILGSSPLEIEKMITESGLNINVRSKTEVPLISAAIAGRNPETIKVLLKHKPTFYTNNNEHHPLLVLVSMGEEELTKIFCEAIDSTKLSYELERRDIFNPTYRALENGYISIAKTFMEYGGDPSYRKGYEKLKSYD